MRSVTQRDFLSASFWRVLFGRPGIFLLLLLGCALLLAACDPYKGLAERRAAQAEAATGEILMAVVDTRGEFSFARGAQLAVEETNARGGVLRRELRPLLYDDDGDVKHGRRIAREIALNEDVIAVIGHNDSEVAIAASLTYHEAGLLFLSPEASDPALTRHRLPNTFRNTLTSEDTGRQLAEFAFQQGFRNMVILYQRTDVLRRLAEVFHERAIEQGIDIIARRSYSPGEDTSYSALIAEIKNYDTDTAGIDAIFLAGEVESAADIIQQSRVMGLDQPFMGGENFDSPRLWQLAGKAAEGTIVPALFDPNLLNKKTREFVKRFEARFGTPPTTWDAQGYDAMQLLAHVIDKSGSTDPAVLASTLRFLEFWESVSGIYSFTENGDITGRTLFFKEVRNGKFEFLKHEKLSYRLTEQTLRAVEEAGMPDEALSALEQMAADGVVYADEQPFLRAVEAAVGSEKTARYQETLLHYSREQQAAREIDPLYEIESITLRLPLAKTPDTLDPARSDDVEIAEQLFLGLTAVDPATLQAVPELASWEILDDDRRVYRFRLRPDAFWTDGVQVTAEDVAWTLRRNAQPDAGIQPAEMTAMLDPVVNARAIREGRLVDPAGERLGVRVIDPLTLDITLEHPVPYFPLLAASDIYRPLPRHVIAEYGDAWAEPEHIQTSGPYALERWYKEMVIILRKNPRFSAADRVSIPEIRFYSVSNGAMGLTMYQENTLDVMGGGFLPLPQDALPKIKGNPAMQEQFSVQPRSSLWLFGFHTARPPFENPQVRKAIAAAIDRRLFLELSAVGSRQPTTTITPPSAFGAVEASQAVGIQFDPLQARRWLEEAGFPNGAGVPEIRLLTPPGSGEYALAIQTFLKHYVNIDVVFDEPNAPIDTPDAYRRALERDDGPDMFLYAYQADYPDADDFLRALFHPASPKALNPLLRWSNSAFNEMVEAAMQTEVAAERRLYYRRAEEIVCQEDVAVVPFFYETVPVLIKPRVKGVRYNPIGGQDMAAWSFLEE